MVDVLISLVDPELEYGLREDLAIAIGAFDAPRVTEFFLVRLETAESSEEIYDAASQLGRRDRAGLRDRLEAIVRTGASAERVAATAELLAGEPELPADVAVVVAALEDQHPAPEIDDLAMRAWIELLGGPFASSARDRLEEQGEEMRAALDARAESLAADDREWLARWGGEASPGPGPGGEPDVVAAAVDANDAEAIARLLGDERAAVRAAARDRMVALGAKALPALRAVALDGSEPARAAAVRALLDLGDDDWLARELLGAG